MKIYNAFLILLIAIALSSIPGCKDNTTDTGTNDTFPASKIGYYDHIQPIFNTYCATIDCHDSYTRSGNLSLASYFDATARAGIIVKYNANASILVQRIEGKIQPQMPPNRAPLSTNKIQAIKTWINEGAKDTTYAGN